MNTECIRNSKAIKKSSILVNFADIPVPRNYIDNKHHLFGPPALDYEEKINKVLYSSDLISKSKDLVETDIIIVLEKLRKKAKLMRIDIDAFIRRNFQQETVDYLSLKNFLIINFDLSEVEANVLLNRFTSKPSQGLVSGEPDLDFKQDQKDMQSSGTENKSEYINLHEIGNFFDFMRNIGNSGSKQENKTKGLSERSEVQTIVSEEFKGSKASIRSTNQNTRRDRDYKAKPTPSTADFKASWVNKVAAGIDIYQMNLYDVLSQYDYDHDGVLSLEDIKYAFLKMNMDLDETDIRNMFAYFNISNISNVNLKEFCRNFMNNVLMK